MPLTIYNDDQYEKEEFLKVVLEDVSGGATFAAGPNGEEVSSCTCQVRRTKGGRRRTGQRLCSRARVADCSSECSGRY